MAKTLSNEKAEGRNAQGGVVVEALPTSALVMREAELLLEFLVVPLDSPAELGEPDERDKRRGLRQSREPELRRLWLVLRPLDEQPDRLRRRAAAAALVVLAGDLPPKLRPLLMQLGCDAEQTPTA